MKKKNDPAISVGTPVYNGERYLGEAIDSILSQSFSGKPGMHFHYSFPVKENENVENSE
jgi:hypothetical protein